MAGPILRTVERHELERPPRPALAEHLERGAVLLFPPGLFPLPAADDLAFLRDELGALATLKNVSYHPDGDFLSGLKNEPAARSRTRAILRAYNAEAERFLTRALPEYAGRWRAGKVNFRPFEEEGRELSPHSSNERVHVDAFASGATHGDRILRFFTNVHPSAPRVWKSAGLFPELYAEFGASAGVDRLGAEGLRERLSDRALSGLVRFAVKAGLAPAAMLDTSPYDRAMKRMHDTLKDDLAFQADERRWTILEFPPFSSWIVLTDLVSHAVIRGQHAIVNTWIVPLASCAVPELAPYHLMGSRGAPAAGAHGAG